MHVGDILSTVRDIIMINVWDKLSTMGRGVFSTLGDIMSTKGVLLSIVEDTQYRGDTMIHVGTPWVPWGKNSFIWVPPRYLWYPYMYHGISHCTAHTLNRVVSPTFTVNDVYDIMVIQVDSSAVLFHWPYNNGSSLSSGEFRSDRQFTKDTLSECHASNQTCL